VGLGYDVHRFAQDRPLWLGGVRIEHPLGLDGHSDADVVLHAIADALLGASALGDIGQHFPDTDPAYAGANSCVLLAKVAEMLHQRGFVVVNVDVTVIAEQPHLAPYRNAMRENISSLLRTDLGAVSVKATTNERMGALGRGEGIAALAVVLISQNFRP
jgi:2-C-methyl-D-erythritol 2,4-cyclodiphosphate synthase